MSITEKLIVDAVYAIEARDLAPRGVVVAPIVQAALEAFEASLSRCGCDDCSTVRRENNGLSEHDRTTLARVLHEIVYSPGATYDRAVPGIQEHVLSCADKVAAALPWLRPVEVPEPSAEGYAEFEGWEQEMFRHQPVLSMHDGSVAGCQCLDRVFVKGEDWGTHLATVITSRIGAEPQGEPSDNPKQLVHEVNMMLSSVASHGPAALTTTDDPLYTAGLLRRLRDVLDPTPAQFVAAGEAVRVEMARCGLDAHRMVYGQSIASVLAGIALRAAGGV